MIKSYLLSKHANIKVDHAKIINIDIIWIVLHLLQVTVQRSVIKKGLNQGLNDRY